MRPSRILRAARARNETDAYPHLVVAANAFPKAYALAGARCGPLDLADPAIIGLLPEAHRAPKYAIAFLDHRAVGGGLGATIAIHRRECGR